MNITTADSLEEAYKANEARLREFLEKIIAGRMPVIMLGLDESINHVHSCQVVDGDSLTRMAPDLVLAIGRTMNQIFDPNGAEFESHNICLTALIYITQTLVRNKGLDPTAVATAFSQAMTLVQSEMRADTNPVVDPHQGGPKGGPIGFH